jgi:glyoxylase-like metal-dependent hydrolase (beta-lactamase superfamily II)
VTHPAHGRLRAVTTSASVLLCDNPSVMTLEGTNTWVLRAPGNEDCVVVDPGPRDEAHLQRVAALGRVVATVLTHGHDDHAEGARRFAEITGSTVHAVDPRLRLGTEGLPDGAVIAAAGVELRVLATPGHTGDSVCLVLDGDGEAGSVLTGDTVLGRGSTVIDPRTGELGDYLASLQRLAELAPGTTVLPGHGPELPDAGVVARQYLVHREQRLEQVRVALGTLGTAATARQVVELVYADVDPALWPAAEWSVQAQIRHLRSS